MKSCKYYFDTEAKQNYDHVHAGCQRYRVSCNALQSVLVNDCLVCVK